MLNETIQYLAIDFYENVKLELEKIAPKEYLSKRYGITQEIYSLILGQGSNHISNKRNDHTQIALDLLDTYLLHINSRLSIWRNFIKNKTILDEFQEVEHKIQYFFDKYTRNNILKRYSRGISSVFDNHPNLVTTYFLDINTKQKAYWLGWLFAEAWISNYGKSAKKRPLYRFGVACSKKDHNLIKRFANTINFKVEKIKIRNYETTKGIKQLLVIRFSNYEFCEFLKWHGFLVGNKKSNNIRFPKMKNNELELAFLLGYFDGDGKQNTTKISSGSKCFLKDIKKKFEIKSPIQSQESEFYDTVKDRIVHGKAYIISLGPELFNMMLSNYYASLKRKRIRRFTLQEKICHMNKMRASKRKLYQ